MRGMSGMSGMSGPGEKPARTNPPGSVTIRCRQDGGLVVEMPPDAAALGIFLRVTDHEGREFILPTDKRAVALCRCGHSEKKPFCDGSHRAAGMTARDCPPGAGG